MDRATIYASKVLELNGVKAVAATMDVSAKLTSEDGEERVDRHLPGFQYSDSDWAGDVEDRQSTSGYIFK